MYLFLCNILALIQFLCFEINKIIHSSNLLISLSIEDMAVPNVKNTELKYYSLSLEVKNKYHCFINNINIELQYTLYRVALHQ